ncbi:unnamed protein product [Porites lobata]|uniref:Uncharacterized protein n=1 Tax=Porites lobata TaxID=104759 RepID=A0ABN8PWK6_9CNID|nr:unnamed protein product [Porites lobata]
MASKPPELPKDTLPSWLCVRGVVSCQTVLVSQRDQCLDSCRLQDCDYFLIGVRTQYWLPQRLTMRTMIR